MTFAPVRRPSRDDPPAGRLRLLVLRARGLGDLLVAVPALRALRQAFPNAEITLAGPAALTPLARLTGAVDVGLPVPDPAGGSHPAASNWAPLPWAGPPPDLAVNLHGRGPQSTAALRSLGPGRLWAFASGAIHPAVPTGPEWVADEHEVRRWCRLLVAYGVPADHRDLSLPRGGHPAPVPDAVVIQPGAPHASRRWPPDRFADVAAALAGLGHRVVVCGGPQERNLAQGVARMAGLDRSAVFAGDLHVLDLAALVADARLVVCGDTGIAHLATAYGTPSVLLFGPNPPARSGPPADLPQHVVLWRGSGAGDPHADRPDPALLDIPTEDVLAAATALLDRTPAPSSVEVVPPGHTGPPGRRSGGRDSRTSRTSRTEVPVVPPAR